MMTAFVHWIITLSLLAVFPATPQRRGTNSAASKYTPSGSDWAEWRGPQRDGQSPEKGLPESWSPNGDNLVWKAPYGGRSAPIVMGNRVFMLNSAGKGASLQERVLSLDADTGKLIWEYKYNIYATDVPPRRIAWSSPAGDPATGNIYTFGATGMLLALSYDGRLLWERALTDEFGAWTTHGGRTVSPVVDGNLVIVSTVTEGWGDLAQRRHRFYAFDKLTGECVWISEPGGRPFDTTYSTPIITTINGTRMMISGGGDGAVHALKVSTGERVWSYAVSKRGLNQGIVLKGATAFISHPEENLDTNEMGLLAAIDATATGDIGRQQIKWAFTKFQLGPSSPVLDGDRLYQIDAGANLFAFDTESGKEIWKQNLGTLQKASPVLADGKLYVGTENGKFFILKPGPNGCQILDADELPNADPSAVTEGVEDNIAGNEQILASVAVSRGRIYLVSTEGIYCIGKKQKSPALPAQKVVMAKAPANATVAHVQVVPADTVLQPGQSAKFKVRLFDAKGQFIREAANATWSMEGLKGTAQNNQFTPNASTGTQAGRLKATVDNVTGVTRVRVIAPLPVSEDFENVAEKTVPAYWINMDGKYAVRKVAGNNLLVKNPNPPAFKRARSFAGPPDMADYTVEVDFSLTEKRRQMGDAGAVAQRYELVAVGSKDKLELRSWQIEPDHVTSVPFKWKADTWFRLKLRVENQPDGSVRARGKAWAVGEAEPEAWMIERVEPAGSRKGSPGIFADAPFELYLDNFKVTPNK